ncbi:hypothetical protein KGQ20_11160 [Catenulispora sp. NF23]|nr:hypothetical protein [Catenulispora pinistramenti]
MSGPGVQRGSVLDGQGEEVVAVQRTGGRRVQTQFDASGDSGDVEDHREQGAVGPVVVQLGESAGS